MLTPYNLRTHRKPVVRLIETMNAEDTNTSENTNRMNRPTNDDIMIENRDSNDEISKNVEDFPNSNETKSNDQRSNNIDTNILELILTKLTNLEARFTALEHKLTDKQTNFETSINDQQTIVETTLTTIESKQEQTNTKVNDLIIQMKTLEEETQGLKSEEKQNKTNMFNLNHHFTSELVRMDENQTKIRAELDNKIQEIGSKILTNKKEIEQVDIDKPKPDNYANKQDDQIQEDLKKLKQKGMSNLYVQKIGLLNAQENIPKFNGKGLNPMESLEKMIIYLDLNIETQENGEYCQHDLNKVMSIMLEGSDYQWWQIIRYSVKNKDDLRENFEKKYWYENIQSGIKRRILNGYYMQGGRQSQSGRMEQRNKKKWLRQKILDKSRRYKEDLKNFGRQYQDSTWDMRLFAVKQLLFRRKIDEINKKMEVHKKKMEDFDRLCETTSGVEEILAGITTTYSPISPLPDDDEDVLDICASPEDMCL